MSGLRFAPMTSVSFDFTPQCGFTPQIAPFFVSTANLLNGHDGIRTRMVVWQLSGELALAD